MLYNYICDMIKFQENIWYTTSSLSDGDLYQDSFKCYYLNALNEKGLVGIGINPFDIPINTGRDDGKICDEILEKHKILIPFWIAEKNGVDIHAEIVALTKQKTSFYDIYDK